MLPTTTEAVKAVLKSDPTVQPGDRNRLLALLRNHGKVAAPEPVTERTERIVRRTEAASRFGCSLRALDRWAHSGILHKVKLPGRIRASGFRESDIVALMRGPATGNAA